MFDEVKFIGKDAFSNIHFNPNDGFLVDIVPRLVVRLQVYSPVSDS